MDLVKSWLGQTLRATGAAVVIPAAILAALALTAIGGAGLGDLGSLSQVVAGPRAAGSDVSVDDGGEEIGDALTQLAAADTGVPGGAGPGPTAPGLPDSGRGDDDGTAPPGSLPDGRGTPPGAEPPPDDGGDDGGDGGPPGEPPPPPPPEPGVVGGLGENIKDATEGTPVAPTVEDAVDTLVETCNQVGCP